MNKIIVDNVSFTEDEEVSKAFNESFSCNVWNLNENLPSIETSVEGILVH